ncbi:MAG: FHA domain-containing protein [Chloroflexota bacterium]
MKNEPGAQVCIYCNTPIGSNQRQRTVVLPRVAEMTGALTGSLEHVLDAPTERFMDFELPSKGIALINLEDGQPIAMLEEKAFILGRTSTEITTQEPLVDLTAFGALELGISRLHAMIRKTRDGYQITDLGSSNGTWLESQRLMPKQPYPLASGDRIRMGRLNVLVFYP